MTKYEYINIHKWLRLHHGKASKCENENCPQRPTKRYEWALLKGKDYKRDRNNFIQLCTSCHKKYDYTQETKNKISEASRRYQKKHSNLKRIEGQSQKAVVQKNKKNEVINTFPSLTLASKQTGILISSISMTLHNKSKTAGGYIWEYL